MYKLKALFIGGTGTVSTAVSELAVSKGWELYLLNRGNKPERVPAGAHVITGDIKDEEGVAKLIGGMKFDVVADFIAFEPFQIERDIRLFAQKTEQFIFISTVAVYQKPLPYYMITEGTPLGNSLSLYGRNKAACEERLKSEYLKNGFPFTVVRPGHTYDERSLPLSLQGKKGCWQVIDRIMKGKPVLIHGDGSSLWCLINNRDFAKGFVGIMGNRSARGESVHITSDELITWDQIYDRIGDALKMEVNKFHVATDFLTTCDPSLAIDFTGDKSHSCAYDNSKIKRLVPGFAAATPFDQGSRICVEYMLSHPAMQQEDGVFDSFCDKIIKVQEEATAAFYRL